MSTPHMARAAEAASHAMTREISGAPRKPWIEESAAHRDGWTRIAHAAVSAALHDPDDPDWLERAWIESSPAAGPGAWDRANERVRERTRHRFDAVRAALLGGDA